MLKSLLKLLPGKSSASEKTPDLVFQVSAPTHLEEPDSSVLDVAASLIVVEGLPAPDWRAVGSWVSSISDPAAQAKAWSDAEVAWLAHMQEALGPRYHLAQHEYAVLLSPLEPRVAAATVQFMTKTLSR
ncbi:hypothetical protein [Rubrivivax albus]|uniref:Uncharacterized protein n=1 Tax=Rubrivivax albus TaxID=2499835 RepID=A0A437JLR0_9BURK|nr:hypothetical protein [Rubrivivax albus]RVT47699.1 hypothetical protein ENE75_23645 [Rubrivivax albus]